MGINCDQLVSILTDTIGKQKVLPNKFYPIKSIFYTE